MQSETDKVAVEDEFVPAQWMSLSDALDAMQSKYGYLSAKENLLELIADEKVSLRCSQPRQTRDFGRVRRFNLMDVELHEFPSGSVGNQPETHPAQPMLISKSFFGRGDGWRIDPERVDWKMGIIAAKRPAKMQIERMGNEAEHLDWLVANNVMLETNPTLFPLKEKLKNDGQDIESVDGTNTSKKVRGKRGTTGPRIKRYAYHLVMDPLFAMIATGELEKKFGKLDVRGTQANIGRHIRDKLDDCSGQEPSVSVYQNCAKEVMQKWREHDAARNSGKPVSSKKTI